jgi:hypothetical protein
MCTCALWVPSGCVSGCAGEALTDALGIEGGGVAGRGCGICAMVANRFVWLLST